MTSTSGVCTVAVDVGNSALKLCVRRSESKRNQDSVRGNEALPGEELHDEEPLVEESDVEELIEHSIYIDDSDWHQAAIDWVRDHVRCGKTRWWIASVHRDAADQLSRAIATEDESAFVRQVRSTDVPIRIDVDEPDRVGVDRLLGAFAAWNRFKSAVAVVDAGSAITVDWVCNEGRFRGGAIMPGLQLQTRVLATGTDALPKIEWRQIDKGHTRPAESCHPLSPAKNTADAIRLGILTGSAAGIDRLVENYASVRHTAAGPTPSADAENLSGSIEPMQMTSGNATRHPVGSGRDRLVVTGGDAMIISQYLKHQHELVSNLVCRGLLDMAESPE